MVPTDNRSSRYRTAVNRSVARRRAALAALALMPGVACSAYDDAEVFRTATTIPTENADATDTSVVEPFTEAVAETTETIVDQGAEPAAQSTTTSAPVVETTTEPAATDPAITEPATTEPATTLPTVATFAAGAELAVSFTFSPTDGGRRIENPYIAVWVEDTSGTLVRTISLWYEQSEEGPKWLSHLSRWTSVTDSSVDTTTSGATRVPGDYTVVWDGVADDGSVVADGEYVLFVEASRRGGAYDITNTQITVSGGGFFVQLPDSGELTAVSVELFA